MDECVARLNAHAHILDLGPEVMRVGLRSVEAVELRRHDGGQQFALEPGQR